ncbi:MAG: FKBP-type peptidyl-prolyl cis-trans isomerase [Proteobacteria bacterium]|nr:FKBP-type peptidyl-prolyl cis-trans isomerase [Pseudomonadota bacterium]
MKVGKITASHGRERMEKAARNRREGQAFLEENGKKEGVVTLPSGLQYRVIQEGGGASPGPEDRVTVHYRGTLLDGTEFDSSYSRKAPETFQVNGVISGWREALHLMPEGSRWELVIPSDLAYGSHGAGSRIGPNCTLVFEVELLSVNKK